MISEHEAEKQYYSEKNNLNNMLPVENVPQHLLEMESILDMAIQKMDALEKTIAEYVEFQSKIQKLEKYYTSQQWKDDYAMDEKGELPDNLKRGILSEDGIYNMLERNNELLDMIVGERDENGQ